MGKIKMYLSTNPLLVDNHKLLRMVMEEIMPIRWMLTSDVRYAPPTEDQLRSFGIFMNENLKDYKKRIPVIQAITGVPQYTSTSIMTKGAVSVLIDVLTEKDWDGHFIRSDLYDELVPALEHLIELEGGVCPDAFYHVELLKQ